jgi:hypothetical protein
LRRQSDMDFILLFDVVSSTLQRYRGTRVSIDTIFEQVQSSRTWLTDRRPGGNRANDSQAQRDGKSIA